MKLDLYGFFCECYKPNCKICHTYTVDMIDNLSDQVRNTIAWNQEGFLKQELYDYKSCFDKNIHLIGEIYLSFLVNFRNSLVYQYDFKLEKCDINKAIETIKDYVSTCPEGFSYTLLKNSEGVSKWMLQNPEFAGFKEWERAVKKEIGVTEFDEVFNEVSCELVFDALVSEQTWDVIFDLQMKFEKKDPVITYKEWVTNTQDIKECIIKWEDQTKLIECKLQYQELFKQYNCSLKIEEYLKFRSCGISHEFIMSVYECGLSLKDSIVEGCPDIIINDHAYNMCDLSFSELSKQKIINKLKEISLI